MRSDALAELPGCKRILPFLSEAQSSNTSVWCGTASPFLAEWLNKLETGLAESNTASEDDVRVLIAALDSWPEHMRELTLKTRESFGCKADAERVFCALLAGYEKTFARAKSAKVRHEPVFGEQLDRLVQLLSRSSPSCPSVQKRKPPSTSPSPALPSTASSLALHSTPSKPSSTFN